MDSYNTIFSPPIQLKDRRKVSEMICSRCKLQGFKQTDSLLSILNGAGFTVCVGLDREIYRMYRIGKASPLQESIILAMDNASKTLAA